MRKRLVVCCDGTWNTPDQQQDGVATPTNVSKIAMAVAPTDAHGIEQRMFYDLGVGTKRSDRILGGAFGAGLSRNVRDAYRFLVQNFEPGDELFFFGFSRGAFTARSTVGFVRNVGILRREHADHLDHAYALYRSRSNTSHPRSIEATLFRRSYSHETRIRFIGVWDTVGALGIPIGGLRALNLLNRRWQFHDTDLSSTVDAAFQALAIDEKRRPFKPTLWTQQTIPDGQQLEQVWFPGVHCDVGGGYLDHQISDIPLCWMVDRARSCGLGVDTGAFTRWPPGAPPPGPGARPSLFPDPLGGIHESRKGFYRMIKPFTRQLGVSSEASEYVASTAVDRRLQLREYQPPGLASYLERNPRDMPVKLEL